VFTNVDAWLDATGYVNAKEVLCKLYESSYNTFLNQAKIIVTIVSGEVGCFDCQPWCQNYTRLCDAAVMSLACRKSCGKCPTSPGNQLIVFEIQCPLERKLN